MAVESQLSDQEIASLMEVPHLMEAVIACHPLDTRDAMIEDARSGALIDTTWMS